MGLRKAVAGAVLLILLPHTSIGFEGRALHGALPASAQGEPGTPPLPAWERSLYKTLTFQTAANVTDVLLFAAIVNAGAVAGAAFLAANTATAAVLYYPYELMWSTFGPTTAETTPETIVTKAVGYQVLTAARNLALVYAFTGALLPAAGFAVATFAVDAAIYVANEVAWDAFRPRTEP